MLGGVEAIGKRPGMHIGDLGRSGAAHLVALAAEMLASLTINRDTSPVFSYHAFLHVTLDGDDAVVVIDAHPGDAPDLAMREDQLVSNRDKFTPNDMKLNRGGPNCLAPLPVLRALTHRLHISRHMDGQTKPILVEDGGLPAAIPVSEKGLLVAARFTFSDVPDSSDLTSDYLEGYLQGYPIARGLVLRDCRVADA
ncbi:MAG: hypothetical protein HKO95_14575, partial [Rhodobacteraceae bacterium]|nr:hypothetical protein [Paracoccaceae bacterium]